MGHNLGAWVKTKILVPKSFEWAQTLGVGKYAIHGVSGIDMAQKWRVLRWCKALPAVLMSSLRGVPALFCSAPSYSHLVLPSPPLQMNMTPC